MAVLCVLGSHPAILPCDRKIRDNWRCHDASDQALVVCHMMLHLMMVMVMVMVVVMVLVKSMTTPHVFFLGPFFFSGHVFVIRLWLFAI